MKTFSWFILNLGRIVKVDYIQINCTQLFKADEFSCL